MDSVTSKQFVDASIARAMKLQDLVEVAYQTQYGVEFTQQHPDVINAVAIMTSIELAKDQILKAIRSEP